MNDIGRARPGRHHVCLNPAGEVRAALAGIHLDRASVSCNLQSAVRDEGVDDDTSSTEQATPGQRDRVWSTVANVALIFGALVTVYLVYLAFTSVP
jgi:hypothetical protein